MIVTLVANSKKFTDGLKSAGDGAKTFGAVVGGAMNLALGAIGLLASAVFLFLPNFIRMGEEARKSELRLASIAKTTGLFGEETEAVTSRVSKYAEQLSFLTGVDDELIRGNQAVLLTFKDLAKTAGTVGGAFDRATVAALDLSAAGLGDAESSAVQLGKALQDPVNGLTALRRAGVTFTDAEKEKIRVLVESGRQLEAQDEILKAIEGQVGGTAAAIASATDKMNARFESVAEELSLALLPAVDDIAEAMIDWLDSVEGKKAIKTLTDELIAFGDWITSPDGKQAIDELGETIRELGNFARDTAGFFKELKGILDAISQFNMDLFKDGLFGTGLFAPEPAPSLGTRSSGGAYPGANTTNINIQGITPTATIGRTINQAVNTVGRYGR
jgi:hypothetical protein